MTTSRIKGLLLSGLLLAIAIGMTVFIYVDTNRALTLVEVPVAKEDLKKGKKVEKRDLTMIKVNRFSAEALGMIPEDAVVGKYTAFGMKKGDLFKKASLKSERPAETVGEMVIKGALTISTDNVKCVGGKVKTGDHVRLWLVTKDNAGLIVTSPPNLARVKILDVGVQGGEEVKTITFEADENQQRLIVETEHGGKIHLALLPIIDNPVIKEEN